MTSVTVTISYKIEIILIGSLEPPKISTKACSINLQSGLNISSLEALESKMYFRE